jgi:hypothetical protein
MIRVLSLIKSVDLPPTVVKEMGCLMTGETPRVCGSLILGRYQDEKQHVPEVGREFRKVVRPMRDETTKERTIVFDLKNVGTRRRRRQACAQGQAGVRT